MSDSKTLGETGEELAAAYLTRTGFKIIHRNWHWGRNEIDVIAEKEGFIVFVEVKTRTGDFFDDPVNAVNRTKQRSIIYAAEGYMKRWGFDKECRFDVVTVIIKNDEHTIEHIPDAFYPTLR